MRVVITRWRRWTKLEFTCTLALTCWRTARNVRWQPASDFVRCWRRGAYRHAQVLAAETVAVLNSDCRHKNGKASGLLCAASRPCPDALRQPLTHNAYVTRRQSCRVWRDVLCENPQWFYVSRKSIGCRRFYRRCWCINISATACLQ